MAMRKARGSAEFKKYQAGSTLTVRQCAKAKCYECMGGYADGTMDCKIPECPLYPFMPYGSAPAPKRKLSPTQGYGRKSPEANG